MEMKVISTLLVSCVLMNGAFASSPYQPQHGYKEEPRPYNFNYAVDDKYAGINFGQNEYSDGKNVQGSYNVQLPDGRWQNVKYQADHHNGFQAEVSYKGKAQFPSKVGKPFIVRPKFHPGPSYDPHH